MTDLTIAGVLAWLLAAFFLIGTVTNVILPGTFRQDYARWGYPDWFHWVTAVLELAVVILLVFPAVRLFGAALGVAVMIAAVGTLLIYREYKHAIAPIVIMVLAAVCGWLTYFAA